jgi:CheY-like chemotaxis protein
MNQHAPPFDNPAIFSTAHRSPRPRLLIVDDHASVRALHARVLNLRGYRVVTAGDGATALERLAEQDFDLVITDREMPVLDGVSMTLALRSAGSHIPIVMFSHSLTAAPLPPEVVGQFVAVLTKSAHTAKILSVIGCALGHLPARSRKMRGRSNLHPRPAIQHEH